MQRRFMVGAQEQRPANFGLLAPPTCPFVQEPCKKSNCPVVPCTVAKLACPEGQQCVNDYCNCAARCGISPEEVPGCKNPVPCLVAPCEFNNPCAADELCVDDYCGGCFARCRKQASSTAAAPFVAARSGVKLARQALGTAALPTSFFDA